MLAAVIRSRRVSEAPERRDGAFGAVPPGGPDQNAISENGLPSTKAASPLWTSVSFIVASAAGSGAEAPSRLTRPHIPHMRASLESGRDHSRGLTRLRE